MRTPNLASCHLATRLRPPSPMPLRRRLTAKAECQLAWSWRREEFHSAAFNGAHHQSAVQEFVSLLARSFRNQQTTVASSAQQRRMVMSARLVMGADGIVRTKGSQFECFPDKVFDATSG